jgi:hypothetical protein
MSILFGGTVDPDTGVWTGSTEIEDIDAAIPTYGFGMSGISFQLLPQRVLDKHGRDFNDGVNIYGGYYSARVITIRGLVAGTSSADLASKIAALATVLKTAVTKPFNVSYLHGSGWVSYAALRNGIQRGAMQGTTTQEVTLEFILPQPFAEGEQITQPDTGTGDDTVIYTR